MQVVHRGNAAALKFNDDIAFFQFTVIDIGCLADLIDINPGFAFQLIGSYHTLRKVYRMCRKIQLSPSHLTVQDQLTGNIRCQVRRDGKTQSLSCGDHRCIHPDYPALRI